MRSSLSLRGVKQVLFPLLLCAAVGFLVLIVLIYSWVSLPTDREMSAFFKAHKSTYEEIRGMLLQDRNVKTVWQDEMTMYDLKDRWSAIIAQSPAYFKFPMDRFEKYHELMRAVGAASITQNDDGSILISKGGYGLGSYGARWGFMWIPVAPPPAIVQSIDDRQPQLGPGWRYRPLGGDWYSCLLVGPE